jgi:hypothetical protein
VVIRQLCRCEGQNQTERASAQEIYLQQVCDNTTGVNQLQGRDHWAWAMKLHQPKAKAEDVVLPEWSTQGEEKQFEKRTRWSREGNLNRQSPRNCKFLVPCSPHTASHLLPSYQDFILTVAPALQSAGQSKHSTELSLESSSVFPERR